MFILINTLVKFVRKNLFHSHGLHEKVFEEWIWGWVVIHDTFDLHVEFLGSDCNKGKSNEFVLCVLKVALGLIVLRLAEVVSMFSRGTNCKLMDKITLISLKFSIAFGRSTFREPLSAAPAIVVIMRHVILHVTVMMSIDFGCDVSIIL